ncbi:MAG: hypothetical protein AABY32_00735 [Nanoarchaeota archaeon]
MERVSIKDFGKDHWSLLAYIETRVIDNNVAMFTGELDRSHLRCNPITHGILLDPRRSMRPVPKEWDYGTRLNGYWNSDDTINKDRQIPGHDDWDCLEDFEEAGLIEIMSTINAFVMLTSKGLGICEKIRKHKASGENFASFVLEEEQKECSICGCMMKK